MRSYPGHAGSSAHSSHPFFVLTVLNQIFGSVWPEAPGVVPQSDWGPGRGGHAGSQTPQASPCCCRGGSWAPILCCVSASLAGSSCRYTQEATLQVRNRKITVLNSHTDAGLVCCLEGSATSSCDPKKAKHSGGVEGAAPCSAG